MNTIKRKRYICFLFSLALNGTVVAQVGTTTVDSIVNEDPAHALDRFHQTLRYNEPIMYLAVPVIKPILKRSVDLRDGEGKDGYWAEAHFGHRFVVYKGKYYNYPFFQRMRFTFDVSMLTRLTKDESSPILPYNNKFGLGYDLLLSPLKNLQTSKTGLVWTTLQLHHYSNGEADSFFLNTTAKRNNYESGDFSTNYWRIILNFSGSNEKDLLMGGLGYQQEIDLGGPFSMNPELKNYYGDGKILFHLHWIRKPKLITVNTVNRSATNGNTIKREIRRHMGFRTELEYITGDLSLFPHKSKYRWGWHNYFTYMPSVTNDIGFMFHTFLGRDYLNIRFDDVIFAGEIGLYARFNQK